MSPDRLMKALDKAATKALLELPKNTKPNECVVANLALANMKSAIYEELLFNK